MTPPHTTLRARASVGTDRTHHHDSSSAPVRVLGTAVARSFAPGATEFTLVRSEPRRAAASASSSVDTGARSARSRQEASDPDGLSCQKRTEIFYPPHPHTLKPQREGAPGIIGHKEVQGAQDQLGAECCSHADRRTRAEIIESAMGLVLERRRLASGVSLHRQVGETGAKPRSASSSTGATGSR